MFIQSYSSERKQLLICMSLGSLSRLLFKSYHLSVAHKEEAFVGSPPICSSCRTLNLNLFPAPPQHSTNPKSLQNRHCSLSVSGGEGQQAKHLGIKADKCSLYSIFQYRKFENDKLKVPPESSHKL